MTNGLKNLFDTFIKKKQFLANLSPRTLDSYKEIFARYEKHVNASDLPTQETLDQFVIGMREHGLAVTTVNISLRSFNSFLSWLTEHNKIPALRLKKLKEEKRVMKTLSDKQLSALYNWKPQSRAEHRLYTLLCLLIDTGVRINEALTLKNQNVDFDNLLITVMGKGGKERIIPIRCSGKVCDLLAYSLNHEELPIKTQPV